MGRGDAPALTTKSARFDPNGETYVGEVAGTALDSAAKSTSSNSEIVATPFPGSWTPPVATPLLGHHPRDSGDPEAIVVCPNPQAPTGIVVTPIQDAERVRLRKQNGIGNADAGSPMFTMTTRGDHAVAFHATQDPITSGCDAPAVGTNMSVGVIAFDETQITSRENRSRPTAGGPAPTLASGGRADDVGPVVRPRRLTPREWERLFGIPDDFTAISWRGASGRGKWRPAADGPRYRVLGNSIAVPIMRWIGQRILTVEEILRERELRLTPPGAAREDG